MHSTIRAFVVALICALTLALAFAAPVERARSREVSNFALLDQYGETHELRRLNARAVGLFFTANGCPLARQNTAKPAARRGRLGLSRPAHCGRFST